MVPSSTEKRTALPLLSSVGPIPKVSFFKNKFNIFLSSWLFIYLVLVAVHETHVSACGIFHCSAQTV